MPISINSQTARLLTPEGRQEALENMGLASPIAKLAAMVAPDPTTPYSFGALKLMDLPMRRAAVLARARMKQTLSDLGLPDPDLLWAFLERHPRTVEVGSVTRLPKPPGAPGRVFGETRFPVPPLAGEPVQVAITRRAPDRPGALAHELATAATALAGKLDERLPGLIPSYTGHIPLFQKYGPERIGGQLLPSLFDQAARVQVLDQPQAVRALQDWFSLPPALPPAGAVRWP